MKYKRGALENDTLMHGMAPRKDEWKRKQKIKVS